jgi:CIC family chloride channel protein
MDGKESRGLPLTQLSLLALGLGVNTGLRRGLEGAHTGVSLGDVASRNFTVVREDETAFDVIRRMWRRNAIMAVVVRGRGVPRGSDVAGVITKEHVADSVADSVKTYPQ